MTECASRNLSKKQQKNLAAWDTAIADAERRIRAAKEEIEQLRFSIHFLKKQRDAGVPFPIEGAAQTEEASQ